MTFFALSACRDGESAVSRGDRLWADSRYPEALAEYRLGYQRSSSSNELLARVAHAYAVTGDLPHARHYYTELVKRDPGRTDQAVFDYLTLARAAEARTDRYGVAGAVEAAVTLRPGLPVNDLSAGLARYYASTGEVKMALEYFERALSAAGADSVAGLLFEIASVHESSGDCAQAITMFDAFREKTTDQERADQARWHVGNCSWQLARKAEAAGDTASALQHMQRVIYLAAPQNLLDQVWFQKGELLRGLGRTDEAVEAYLRSINENRSGTGQLVERARRRIEEIRPGREPDHD